MLFSEHYQLTTDQLDDWFDPDLSKDTPLFVDPFLIFEDDDPFWAGAHAELIDFFNEGLKLIARGRQAPGTSPYWRKAQRLFLFPEPYEFCIGYAEDTVRGSGSGRRLAETLLDAAQIAFDRGINHLGHFEELALLGPGFGVDRISDMTCNVLKGRFIEYTQEVAKRHNIVMRDHRVEHASWSSQSHRWLEGYHELPENPFVRDGAVLLVPKRFLRRIPVITPGTYWNWACANLGQQLRDDLGDEFTIHADHDLIFKYTRMRPSSVRKFIEDVEQTKHDPYDLDLDPNYIHRWKRDARQLAGELPVATPPTSSVELHEFVHGLCDGFKRQIELHGGWEMLWMGDTPRHERHCQKLFDAVVRLRCQDYDIDLSPETNAGVGPVDFKFSRGSTRKVVTELKLAQNTHLHRNTQNQVPLYMDAEHTSHAILLVVQFQDRHCTAEFMAEIAEVATAIGAAKHVTYHVVWVDARPKASASKR